MSTPARFHRYPTDSTEEEWAFAAPYLTLLPLDASQRRHDLRAVFDALRWLMRVGAPWRLLPGDFPPGHAVYDQAQRWIWAGVFEVMVHDLRAVLRHAQGRPPNPSAAVQAHGIAWEVITSFEAKRGFVLLPRRWVVERSFAWAARCRRLARDYERLPTTLAGLHVVSFATLMLAKATALFDLVRNTL